MDDRTFDKRTMLKVKIKSLAVEARIIRKEEQKPHNSHIRFQLIDHRKGVVRREARHALLAYGFLRGRTRLAMESRNNANNSFDWHSVKKLVDRYGTYNVERGDLDWHDYLRAIAEAKEEQSAAFIKWLSATD